MAEQFGGLSLAENETKSNKNRSINSSDTTSDSAPRRSYFLPPLGGSPNEETAARRITHIGLIAIAATMAFAAITITVAGVIELFSK